MSKPAKDIRCTFICSECNTSCTFVKETPRVAAQRMKASGWVLYEGFSHCSSCAGTDKLAADLEASVLLFKPGKDVA